MYDYHVPEKKKNNINQYSHLDNLTFNVKETENRNGEKSVNITQKKKENMKGAFG